jgi:choline dehydrogenase-like flavoprotein
MESSFDYVVVGGGTSGCVAAAKLLIYNTNAPAMAIGDRAADIIYGKAQRSSISAG